VNSEAKTRGRIGLWALGVVIVALAIAAGMLGYQIVTGQRDEDRRAAALQSAKQTAINMQTLDHKNLQKDIDRVTGGMTGTAKDQWATLAKTLSETVSKTKTASSVQTARAGLVSMDRDSAEVIVWVSAISTNAKVPQGMPMSGRWDFELTRDGDRWLVSKLGVVP
jgi:Mce-associated membrane protein